MRAGGARAILLHDRVIYIFASVFVRIVGGKSRRGPCVLGIVRERPSKVNSKNAQGSMGLYAVPSSRS